MRYTWLSAVLVAGLAAQPVLAQGTKPDTKKQDEYEAQLARLLESAKAQAADGRLQQSAKREAGGGGRAHGTIPARAGTVNYRIVSIGAERDGGIDMRRARRMRPTPP